MDTISPGEEHPHFLMFGTSGTSQTQQESFTLCDDRQKATMNSMFGNLITNQPALKQNQALSQENKVPTVTFILFFI